MSVTEKEREWLEFANWHEEYQSPDHWTMDLNGPGGNIVTLNLFHKGGEWIIDAMCIHHGSLWYATEGSLRAMIERICGVLKDGESVIMQYLTNIDDHYAGGLE